MEGESTPVDEETVKGGAGKGKKKAKKAAVKVEKPVEDIRKTSTDPMEALVVEVMAHGYEAQVIRLTISEMFDKGLEYNDVNAIIKKLKGEELKAASPKKGDKKESKVATEGSAAPPAASSSSSSVPVKPLSKPVSPATKGGEAPAAAGEALSFSDRMVVAASQPNIFDVIKAFTTWLSRSTLDEKVEFFNSKALEAFYKNLLTVQPPSDIDDDLRQMLVLLLGNNSDDVSTLVNLIRTAISNVSFLEVSVAELANRFVTITRLFQHDLSQEKDNSTDKKVKDIEHRIAGFVARDKENSGAKKDDVGAQFRFRDTAHELTTLYLERVKVSLGVSTSSSAANFADLSNKLTAAVITPIDEEKEIRSQEEEFRQQVDKLKGERQTSLNAIQAGEKVVTGKLHKLKEQKEALLKQLREVEDEITKYDVELSGIANEKKTTQAVFHDKLDAISSQHKELAALIRKSDGQKSVEEAIKFAVSEAQNSSALYTASKAAMVSKQLVAFKQKFINSVKIYLEAEIPCVSFLSNRVSTTRGEIAKLEKEIQDFTKLGISLQSVSAESSSKVAKLQSNAKEDQDILSVLQSSVQTILKAVAELFADDDIASVPGNADLLKQIQILLYRAGVKGDQIPLLKGQSSFTPPLPSPVSTSAAGDEGSNPPLRKTPGAKDAKKKAEVAAAPKETKAFSWGSAKAAAPAEALSLKDLMAEERGKKSTK
jgi:hypothetical protein